MEFELISQDPNGQSAGWLVDGSPLFVGVRQRMKNNILGGFPHSGAHYLVLSKLLAATGRLVSFNHECLFRTDEGWFNLDHLEVTEALIRSEVSIVYSEAELPQFRPELQIPGSGSQLNPAQALVKAMAESGVNHQGTLSSKYFKYFVGQTKRPGVPKIDGVVEHPIVTPEGRVNNEKFTTPQGTTWLSLFDSDLPTPNEKYEHLRTLFSGFDFDASSHAALYLFLFGGFHVSSLDYERPILVIDSWCRGRGKTEVANAINYLYTGATKGISLKADRDAMKDELISHCRTGARVLAIHNVESRQPNWNNDLLASLSTDGEVGGRGKYAKLPMYFPGIMCIINTVYGAASLHKDLVDRSFRAELTGPATKLSVRPIEYAKKYRMEILSEIIQAHTSGGQWELSGSAQSRLAPFEIAAAKAYREVFGKAPEIIPMLSGRRALEQKPMTALYRNHKESFEAPNDRIMGVDAEPGPEYEGATALGHTVKGGRWE